MSISICNATDVPSFVRDLRRIGNAFFIVAEKIRAIRLRYSLNLHKGQISELLKRICQKRITNFSEILGIIFQRRIATNE